MADRVVNPSELTGVGVTFRNHPVRVEIEYSAGRMLVLPSPDELTIKDGEGIEWDFRYMGGADVMVDEIVVEFSKPAPFAKASMRMKKPGFGRPHRILSGPASVGGKTTRLTYTIRCYNSFKTEVAVGKPRLVIE